MSVHENMTSERCHKQIIEGFLMDFHCVVHVFSRPRRLFSPGMPQRPSTWWQEHGVQLTSRCLADGFLFAPKKTGRKKTWKIWDWAKVWWWDSAHRYGQGRHEGPQFGCFNISSFESLSPLITLIRFALRAYKSICASCIFDWPGTSFQFGAMATASRVKRSQAEIWTFAEQWHPGALDFKSVFVTVHEMHDFMA